MKMVQPKGLLKFLTHFLGSFSLLFWLSLVIIGSSVFILQSNEETKIKSKVASINIAGVTTTTSYSSKVILLAWDGAQKNNVQELLAAGKLPNLKKLIDEGRWRDMAIYTQNCRCASDGDNYHTETGPAHAAMLSGYGYPLNNNHSNLAYKQAHNPKYDNESEEVENDCPEVCPPTLSEEEHYQCLAKLGPGKLQPGHTIFERLNMANLDIKIGMITGKNLRFFPFPAFQNAAPTTCCNKTDYQKQNAYFCGLATNPAINYCWVAPDSASSDHYYVGTKFLSFINKYKSNSFFLFAQLKNPDPEGHNYGENSSQYKTAIIDNDKEIGRIVSKLKSLNIYKETIIMVTTDHGFEENGTRHHQCVPETKDIWVVSNKKNVIDNEAVVAKQTSIVPTILDIFGINKNVEPPFAGDSLFETPTPTPTPTPPTPIPGNMLADFSFEEQKIIDSAGTKIDFPQMQVGYWYLVSFFSNAAGQPESKFAIEPGKGHWGNNVLKGQNLSSKERIVAKQVVSLTPGLKLKLSAWARKTSGNSTDQYLRLRWHDANKNLMASGYNQKYSPSIGSSWTKAEFQNITPPAGASWAELAIFSGARSIFYWDDIFLGY